MDRGIEVITEGEGIRFPLSTRSPMNIEKVADSCWKQAPVRGIVESFESERSDRAEASGWFLSEGRLLARWVFRKKKRRSTILFRFWLYLGLSGAPSQQNASAPM